MVDPRGFEGLSTNKYGRDTNDGKYGEELDGFVRVCDGTSPDKPHLYIISKPLCDLFHVAKGERSFSSLFQC